MLTAEVLRMGANCRSVGWDFYGADGEPQLDPYGNPKHVANHRQGKAASKRKRTAARKRMGRKIVGRAAQQGPVTRHARGPARGALVLRVTTGQLNGRRRSPRTRVSSGRASAPRAGLARPPRRRCPRAGGGGVGRAQAVRGQGRGLRLARRVRDRLPVPPADAAGARQRAPPDVVAGALRQRPARLDPDEKDLGR